MKCTAVAVLGTLGMLASRLTFPSLSHLSLGLNEFPDGLPHPTNSRKDRVLYHLITDREDLVRVVA